MTALLPNSPRQVIVVWFSCGAASAVAAKFTLDLYGAYHDVRVVNNPVAEEDEDNRRFLHDVEKWLGIEIEIATCAKYPNASAVEVWEREKFMSGPDGAPCTKFLKKRARQEWQLRNPVDWHVFGFGAEERGRYEDFILSELPNVLPVLIDHGITRREHITICLLPGSSHHAVMKWDIQTEIALAVLRRHLRHIGIMYEKCTPRFLMIAPSNRAVSAQSWFA